MLDIILYFAHYSTLLFFGIALSLSFSGIMNIRKQTIGTFVLFTTCGLMQLFALFSFGEDATWKIYPLITHLPIILTLCIVYKKRFSTAISAVTTAYLFCQPSKWLNLLFVSISGNESVGRFVAIIVFIFMGVLSIYCLSNCLSEIYTKKNTKDIFIFSIVPIVYYFFDYLVNIYNDFWFKNNIIIIEFLPFFLCVIYIIFILTYYQEYEKKIESIQREKIVNITVQQQTREIEAIKDSALKTRILRHDMRHLLENIKLNIEQENKEKALEIISKYISTVEASSLQRFCTNDTINYVLSNYGAKFNKNDINMHFKINFDEMNIDEIMLSSIIANALENALNALKELPISKREIYVTIQTNNNKLLISVKNPFKKQPTFVDGLPVTSENGHGYGTQSIRYLCDKFGGKCQFNVEENMFVTRIII